MNHRKGVTAAMHLSYSVFTCTKVPPSEFYFYFHQPEPVSTTQALHPHRKLHIHPPLVRPKPLPDFQASCFTLPWKKIDNRRAEITAYAAALWEILPSLSAAEFAPFIHCLFVCFLFIFPQYTRLLGVQTGFILKKKKKMASCVICVHSCFDPASRALARDGLPFWH